MQTRSWATADLRTFVRDIRSAVLYYAFWGRNAWWSTWVTQYTDGCIHTTCASAQAYCETKRKQGTVFYINQLPALAIVGSTITLLLTEINTTGVLGRLDHMALANVTQYFPVHCMTLEQMGFLFRAHSSLWPSSEELHSVIMTMCDSSTPLEPLDRGSTLVTRRSSSSGSQYLLGWGGSPSGLTDDAVHAIADTLTKRL